MSSIFTKSFCKWACALMLAIILAPVGLYMAWYVSELAPFYYVALDSEGDELNVIEFDELDHDDLFLVKNYPTRYEIKTGGYALIFVLDTKAEQVNPNLHIGVFGKEHTFKTNLLGCAVKSYKRSLGILERSDYYLYFLVLGPSELHCLDLTDKSNRRELRIDVYKGSQLVGNHSVSYFYKENGYRDNRVWP